MSKTVMVIPAKGSSTRLPGKNVRPFCGHPLVAWSIVQGVNAKCIDEVWVSTDDQEIVDIARYYGAEVMMRDYVDEEETPGSVPIWEFLNRRIADGGLTLDDIMVARLCTTPGFQPDDIDNMYAQYIDVRDRYGATDIGVGCERRTMIVSRKVVPGIRRLIGKDAQCENNYDLVENLAFMSFMKAGNFLPSPENTERARLRDLYGGEHPHHFYYKFHPWQWHDVDTLEEFEIAELETEYFLLKGRDMLEVYQKET